MRPHPTSSVLLALALTALACSKESHTPTTPSASPNCSVSPASLSFGQVTVGASADRQFTLTNSGGGTLAGSVAAACSGFQVVGTGSYALAAGQSRAFTIRFSPPSVGAIACTLSTGHAGCQVVCSGEGVAAPIPCSLNPSALDFGSITVGQSADLTFTLTNQGSATLNGSVDESCSDFSVEGDVLYSLAPGQSATIKVRFLPSAGGARTCTIETGAPGCPTLSASGTGVAANPDCEVSVSELHFGDVGIGDRSDATFSVTNNGTGTLTGTVTEDCPDFSIAGQASYALPPGQSQTFVVRFEPTQVGPQTCTVNVGSGCSTVACEGTGVVGCQFQPAALDFGYVRQGEVRCGSTTLRNNSSTVQQGWLFAELVGGSGGSPGTISLDGVIVSGTTQLPYALNPGQSRTFTVCWDTQFASAPCDTILAVWRIGSTASSSAGCRPAELSTRGVVTRGCACSVIPTTLDFGSVVVGDVSPEQEFQITNESGIDGLRGQVRVLSGDFEVSRDDYACNYAQCISCGFIEPLVKIGVRFRPSALGPQVGKILVENLEGCLGPGSSAICDTVTVTGTGVTASPPSCAVSTTRIDMGTVYFGSSKDTTFTIRNTGGGVLADSIKFLDNSPPFSSITRYYTLGPGDSVNARIRFTSSGTPGHTYAYVGNLSTGAICMAQGLGVLVTAEAREAPQPPSCALSTTSLDFGSVPVGQSKTLTFDLENSGGGSLCGVITESCPEFSLESITSYCITPPGFVRVTVRFSPTSPGFQQCSISPGANCPPITVRGTGS